MGKVCFDFDGVINSYRSGWLGDDIIPDPPVPGIKEAIQKLRAAGYEVVVLSSRSANAYGREAMWAWFEKYGIDIDGIYSHKPPARCYVDDRAVCFNGDPDKLFDIIDNFEPWWKDPDKLADIERRIKDTHGPGIDDFPIQVKESQPPKHMMGAIIGDIVGSVYEFHNIHTEDFPLFGPGCRITDDSILTLAVAQALINAKKNPRLALYDELVDCMQAFGRHYPSSYGGRFLEWLWSPTPEPYNSWGNGAPMRCSAAGWITDDVRKAEALAIATAEPTHDHPYAKNAAATVAGLICMARNGARREELLTYAEDHGYRIPTMQWLMDNNEFDESSQGTMPAALACFFSSKSFEDSIRKAISIGGDSDTIAAITGSIAEAYYGGIPDAIRKEAWAYVPENLRQVLRNFHDIFLKDN